VAMPRQQRPRHPGHSDGWASLDHERSRLYRPGTRKIQGFLDRLRSSLRNGPPRPSSPCLCQASLHLASFSRIKTNQISGSDLGLREGELLLACLASARHPEPTTQWNVIRDFDRYLPCNDLDDSERDVMSGPGRLKSNSSAPKLPNGPPTSVFRRDPDRFFIRDRVSAPELQNRMLTGTFIETRAGVRKAHATKRQSRSKLCSTTRRKRSRAR